MSRIPIGTTIRILRRAVGWNLGELSEKVGVSTSFLCLIEDGKRSPSLDTVSKIAKAFDVSVDVLLLPDESTGNLSSKDTQALSIIKLVSEVVAAEGSLRVKMKVLGHK